MVHLAILTPEMADFDAVIAQWTTADDREKVKDLAHPKRKQSFLAGRSVLRALLHQVTQKADWQIALQPSGKPYLLPMRQERSPFISISHTEHMIACAVSLESEVGIDAEYWRKRDFEALAEYAFSPHEVSLVRQEGVEGFYRLWTLKEALAKAQGKSIFEVLREEKDKTSLGEERWASFSTVPRANYSLSCVARKSDDASQREFVFVPLFN